MGPKIPSDCFHRVVVRKSGRVQALVVISTTSIGKGENTMNKLHRILLGILFALSLPGCVVYEPVGVQSTVPASFDRSWNAALTAAQDAGIAVSVADRNSGRIYGRRNTADVTISVIPQADGSLRVQFDAKGLAPQDQGLQDRFVQAYNRRMGR